MKRDRRIENEPPPSSWTYEQFKAALITAHESGQPGLIEKARLPEQISIDNLGRRAKDCLDMTLATDREHGYNIGYNKRRRSVVVNKDFFFGEPKSDTDPRPSIRMSHHRGRSLGSIHAHPYPIPFSVDDIAVCLSNMENKLEILAEPDTDSEFWLRMLVTTRETRWLKAELIQAKISHWESLMRQRVKDTYVRGTVDNLTSDEQHRLEGRYQDALGKSIARNYGLGYYAANVSRDAESFTLKRVK